MRLVALWAVSALLTLSACGGGDVDEAPTVVPLSTVDRTDQSAQRQAATVVVRSAAEWAQLWAQHTSHLQPPPALPAVDFSQEQVLAVFLGSRPSGCHHVTVLEVLDGSGSRLVRYRETLPSAGQACTLAITHPAHLVRVPASTQPVRFEGV